MAKRADEQGRAFKKSQLQIQIYVNRRQPELDLAVLEALPSLAELTPRLDCVSPLENKGFEEYYDGRFLDAVGLEALVDQLDEFWPKGGPHWDAVAVARDRDGTHIGPVILEAKSWPGELKSGITASPESRERIARALANTRQWLGVGEEVEEVWLNELYQAANRLAHLYFFREVCGQRAWLVNLYVVDDPDCPTSREDWERELAVAERRLGLEGKSVPGAGRVFLPGRARATPGLT